MSPKNAPTAPPAPAAAPKRQLHVGLFGKLPPFTSRQLRIFGIVTTASFFGNYDGALLSLALKQIQRSLHIAEAALAPMASVIRLGTLLSLFLTPVADRYGRRRLLLYTVVAYTVLTGLTAFAWDTVSFVLLRFLSVTFSAAEAAVALVILVEEVEAGVRGWAVGMLGALAATGYGVAALVFAFIEVLPFGWRGLYGLALLPLAIIIPLRRVLPETQRFAQSRIAQERSPWWLPFVTLWTQYPDRLWRLGSVAFLAPLGGAAGGFLTAKYLQEVHQWSPAHVSSLYVLGGAVGVLGNIVAGRLSDRIGRRTLGALCLGLAPCFTLLFFNSAGPVLAFAWIGYLFADTASSTVLNTYSAELFPTTARTTAGSVLTALGTIGGAVGLLLESWLYTHLGSHWRAISSLTVFWLLSSLIVAFSFPETAGQELEALAPDELEDSARC